jgi:hypothetical protein
MTLTMADSITPASLPYGYNAYLGYVDGEWATAAALRQRFPGGRILTLTVLGGGEKADGCDRETGDLTAQDAAEWLHLAIIAGQQRPVLYASRDNVPEVLGLLGDAHVTLEQIRILSACYGLGQHICGPAAPCRASFQADGTQWTDGAPGLGGSKIDASLLEDDFFDASPVPPPAAKTPTSTANWQETMMAALPEVKQGASGEPVRTVQGLLLARGHALTVDGAFGDVTAAAVKQLQGDAHLTADGVVGPLTWPALMGV